MHAGAPNTESVVGFVHPGPRHAAAAPPLRRGVPCAAATVSLAVSAAAGAQPGPDGLHKDHCECDEFVCVAVCLFVSPPRFGRGVPGDLVVYFYEYGGSVTLREPLAAPGIPFFRSIVSVGYTGVNRGSGSSATPTSRW
jgi:hypothetical protein